MAPDNPALPTDLRDLQTALDAIEDDVARRVSAHELAPKVEALLEAIPRDSHLFARALRLCGVLANRLEAPDKALDSLKRAKHAAIAKNDHTELGHIGRETSVWHSWQGAARDAAQGLLHAISIAHLNRDRAAAALALAEVGRIELEAREFASAAMFLRMVATYAAGDLPARELYRVKNNLCQALTRLAQYDEALKLTAEIKTTLPAREKRLTFLNLLEEARAFSGQRHAHKAANSLRAAETMYEEGEFERLEYLEAEAELQLANDNQSAIDTLSRLADDYDERKLVVRAANLRMTLAKVLIKKGESERGVEVLAAALRSAVDHHLLELADRVRTAMLETQADINSGVATQLQESLRHIRSIAGGTALDKRFTFIRQRGRGGFGRVYEVVDLEDGHEVALKKLNIAHHSRPRREQVIATVRNEYSVTVNLKSLQGVALVRGLFVDPEGETLYLVQDLIAGTPLKELYGKAQRAELLLLMAQTADILADLHAEGNVHRDLKPDNVIVRDAGLDGDRHPVLVDFGIAVMIDKPDALPGFGSLDYMSPEQLRGEHVDGGADVYSLGKMIAEIWDLRTPKYFQLGGGPDAMPRTVRRLAWHMLRTDPKRRLCDLGAIASTLRTQAQQILQ